MMKERFGVTYACGRLVSFKMRIFKRILSGQIKDTGKSRNGYMGYPDGITSEKTEEFY